MSIVLDASWGTPTANSYSTIAESNVYHESRYHSADWLSPAVISTKTKTALLVWATSLLDQLFIWDGSKVSITQSRACPRNGILDIENWPIDMTIKPIWIANATAEYAYRLYQEDILANANNDLGNSGSADLEGFKEIKVGSITLKSSIGESKSTSSSSASRIIPLSVYTIIKPYGNIYTSGQRRLVR